jgi:O-antigen/teichoic acid export membrane protein
MLIISIPIGVGTTLLADKVILLIFGAEYLQSVIALQILVWAMVFIFINAAFVRLLESINRQMTVTKITGICMVENIVLNMLMIPQFGYVGASITTVITEFTIVALVIYFAAKSGYTFKKGEVLTNMLRVTVSSVIMGIFIWNLRELNLIILVLLSALLYISLLYIIGGINKEDIKLLKELTGRSYD